MNETTMFKCVTYSDKLPTLQFPPDTGDILVLFFFILAAGSSFFQIKRFTIFSGAVKSKTNDKR